ASLFFLAGPPVWEIVAIVVALIGYWWIMTNLNGPGLTLGDLTKEGNVAAYLDRQLLGGHLYRPVYDPEGILSTLPAIASALFGNLTGRWLRAHWSPSQKVTGMVQAGLILLLIGVKWGAFFPVNKALWTSSYVLVTTGLALLTLAFCY